MYGIGLVRFLPTVYFQLTNTALQLEFRANEREDEPKSQAEALYWRIRLEHPGF